MIAFKHSAALVMLGASLAGCKMGVPDGDDPAFASNRSIYSENQPVVEQTNYVFDVATTGSGIPSGELGRLTEWFDSLDLRYGDRIALDDPYGSAAVHADVARVAAYYGLLLSETAPVTAGTVQPGSTRVVVSRSTASVPGCPNWRQAKLQGAVTSTESNFGCATNSNLAAMIANPEDLVLGAEGSPSGDPASATKAIKSYRDKAPTGAGALQAVSTAGGS